MKEPERRSIALDDHGLALLGEALALWPGSGSAVVGIRSAQAVLGFPVRVTDRNDPEFFWQAEWLCEPELVTARAFAWSAQDFHEFPALWAFSTKDLPERAQYLNQATPIAKRSTQPVDDLMKSLDRWFAREIERRTGIRVCLGTKPVRWGDNYYIEMIYHRDIAPPKKRGKPRGSTLYQDGLDWAELEVLALRSEYQRNGREPSIRSLCEEVFEGVDWVPEEQINDEFSASPTQSITGRFFESLEPREMRIAVSSEKVASAAGSEASLEGQNLTDIAFRRLYDRVRKILDAEEGLSK